MTAHQSETHCNVEINKRTHPKLGFGTFTPKATRGISSLTCTYFTKNLRVSKTKGREGKESGFHLTGLTNLYRRNRTNSLAYSARDRYLRNCPLWWYAVFAAKVIEKMWRNKSNKQNYGNKNDGTNPTLLFSLFNLQSKFLLGDTLIRETLALNFLRL